MGGIQCGRGESGELGCYQFLPTTWCLYSKEIIGYCARQTPINEEFVVMMMIEKWLRDDFTVEQIALMWNQGHLAQCSSGINEFGVPYDSCEYFKEMLKHYTILIKNN